jgi:hypothetical protein
LNSDVVIALVTVVSFLMAAAGVIGSWRASKNTGALSLYRETAQAWEGKSKVQDTEIADLKDHVAQLTEQMHEKDSQLAEQAGRMQVLQDTLTGRAAWEVLEHKIGESLQLVGDMRTEVRSMHEVVESISTQLAGILSLMGRNTS